VLDEALEVLLVCTKRDVESFSKKHVALRDFLKSINEEFSCKDRVAQIVRDMLPTWDWAMYVLGIYRYQSSGSLLRPSHFGLQKDFIFYPKEDCSTDFQYILVAWWNSRLHLGYADFVQANMHKKVVGKYMGMKRIPFPALLETPVPFTKGDTSGEMATLLKSYGRRMHELMHSVFEDEVQGLKHDHMQTIQPIEGLDTNTNKKLLQFAVLHNALDELLFNWALDRGLLAIDVDEFFVINPVPSVVTQLKSEGWWAKHVSPVLKDAGAILRNIDMLQVERYLSSVVPMDLGEDVMDASSMKEDKSMQQPVGGEAVTKKHKPSTHKGCRKDCQCKGCACKKIKGKCTSLCKCVCVDKE
jgi:hypothetical protein